MNAADIRINQRRSKTLLRCYFSLRAFIPDLIKKTPFKTFRILRVYASDQKNIHNILVFFDDSCKISVGEYFICGVKTIKKRKSYALNRSKNLEEDILKLLESLNFIKKGVE